MFFARARAFSRRLPAVLPLLAALVAASLLSSHPAAAQITEQNADFFASSVTSTSSVALSADGNTRLVGIPGESAKGGVHVSTRSGTTWTSQGTLLDAGSIDGEHQGLAVALSADGNTALVISENFAWFYTRSGGVWTLEDGPVGGGKYASLSADGNRALLESSGVATVWQRSGGVWSLQGSAWVTGVAGALSGDGKTFVLGRPSGENGARVFAYSTQHSFWMQDHTLLAGSDEVGPGMQGTSVAISADGKTILSGAPLDDGGRGAAWAFTGETYGGVANFPSPLFITWNQQTKLVGGGASTVSGLGRSVALSADGSTAIAGAPLDDDNGIDSGAIWAFKRNNGAWTQQGSKFFPASSRFSAGQSVAISGNASTIASAANSAGGTNAWVFSQPTVSLEASPNPSIQTQVVTFTATVNVASGTPTGDVTFFYHPWHPSLPNVELGTVPLVSGQASFSPGALLHPRDAIFARYNGDGNFPEITSGDVVLQVHYIDVLLDFFTVDINPSVAGQPVTYSVSLNPPPGVPGPVATGIFIDATPAVGDYVRICDVPLVSGAASCTTNTLSVGTHAIWYNSHPVGGSGQGGGGVDQVVTQGTTTTALASNDSSSVSGQSVTFTATVSPVAPSVRNPAGMVTFKDGATTIGTGTLAAGIATFSTSALSLGAHTISASYDGTADYAASTSSDISQDVGQGATTTSVASNSNPAVLGQSVTFTATVAATAPASGTRTGSVTFMNGATMLGSGNLSGNSATYSTSGLGLGSHTITATYGGDASFAMSTSSGLSQAIGKQPTTMALTRSPANAKPGAEVTLTATATVNAPATGTPNGNVTFKDGAGVLGTRSLSGGIATFKTTDLSIGARSVSAVYNGDATRATSTGNAIVTIDPKVGLEFRANTETANSQQLPAVAKTDAGFVVVWTSDQQDGSGTGIYGQRYRANGATTGSEFRVNTATVNSQTAPAVALNGTGFVVVWASSDQDGSGRGIYGQRYDATGRKAGGEFLANTATARDQQNAAVTGLPAGGFVVVWTSTLQDGSGLGVYGQRFNEPGTKAGAEFRINTTVAGAQSQPSIAGLADGFVVVWQSDGQDGSDLGIYGQRFTSDGKKARPEFLVNTVTDDAQSMPSVAALSDGGFVVAWQSEAEDGAGLGIFAQRMRANGVKAGDPFLVNTRTTRDQSQPTVAGFADGGFVIAWTSNLQDGSGLGVYAQVHTANGQRENIEFRANTMIADNQHQPSAAALLAGNFVVVWTSGGQDGSLEGVYGQRFEFKSVIVP